jgi:hypothetical protein
MQDKLLSISESNEEMLTYFNKLYSEHEKNLQEGKDKLFEINIKLDELTRTESIYSLNTDLRKNIFSPISIKSPENDRETEIQEEVKELSKIREEYEYSVNEETIYLKSIDKRIHKLTKARNAIDELIALFEEGRIKILEESEINSEDSNNSDDLSDLSFVKNETKKKSNSSINIMRSDVDIMSLSDILDNDKNSKKDFTRFETLDDGIKHLKESTSSKGRTKRKTTNKKK